MTKVNTVNDTELLDLLPKYYKRLFPSYLMCKWLGYSEVQKEYFHHREFNFTLKDDIYIRYLSYTDYNEFEKELVRKAPFKIDIGGIYNHPPKESKQWAQGNALQVEENELKFDIDLTDYEDVRFCCKGSDICLNCWPLMQFAIRILDKALEEDFGFQHRLWVYSGRRGVHCWVGDESARKLSSAARVAISEYLTVLKGGEGTAKKVNLYTNMHPSLKRASKIIEKGFVDYACSKQDFLGDETKMTKLLSLIPQECREECLENMRKFSTSQERWSSFQQFIKKYSNKKVKLNQHLIEEICFQYCYPRLDAEVTKSINHLLKSPFCVHPKTGNVCVPIDVDQIDSFDPFKVPTIVELNEQLERCDMISTDKKIRDYKKTDLKSYIEVFERFLNKLEKSWKGKKIEESDIKGMEGDF